MQDLNTIYAKECGVVNIFRDKLEKRPIPTDGTREQYDQVMIDSVLSVYDEVSRLLPSYFLQCISVEITIAPEQGPQLLYSVMFSGIGVCLIDSICAGGRVIKHFRA